MSPGVCGHIDNEAFFDELSHLFESFSLFLFEVNKKIGFHPVSKLADVFFINLN